MQINKGGSERLKRNLEMNEQKWRNNCKKEVAAQIILDDLFKQKKINLKQKKEIQKKINVLGYKNFLSSPHLEGKEKLKKRVTLFCFKSYLSSIGITK